ncbi:MAG: hypothetical protein ACD_39C00063G0001 [uncultured bacterium]|nr:MAG: hypothetical protein ACD_39C00063G0001 [uncultured bacterium]
MPFRHIRRANHCEISAKVMLFAFIATVRTGVIQKYRPGVANFTCNTFVNPVWFHPETNYRTKKSLQKIFVIGQNSSDVFNICSSSKCRFI